MGEQVNDIDAGKIFSVGTDNFNSLALQIFRFQYFFNKSYQQYCNLIHCKADEIKVIQEIPFLPVSFFKSKEIKTTDFEPKLTFKSSSTSGTSTSRHYLKNVSLYEESFIKSFELFYGNISGYCILGLLPSYLERSDSSLVYMTNELIKRSGHTLSGFYLYDHDKLYETLLRNEERKQPTILIGVTFALLDFAIAKPMKLKHTIVIETGGMKGRKKELTREEVHDKLKKLLGIREVHSEYGMTELLSQSYAIKNGYFSSPPWMQVLVRAEDDPFEIRSQDDISIPVTGLGNIIDLANLHSCSFIACDDIIRLHPGSKFEVLGRLDNSDVRGCGLMIM